jgi:WD40 repeat protein
MLRQIASALAFAHLNGVVHGDIKTDNILIDELGNAYLSDFGIAKVLSDKEQGTGIQGTLASISPEQIRGEKASVQSDVYALGVMIFETLTSHKPFFDVSTSGILYKQLNEPLPQLSNFRADLSEELNLVLQRASNKDPHLRYDNVLAFSHAFSRLAHDADELSTVKIKSPTQEGEELSKAKNPYKGLRAFQFADADDFFGRESLVENLLKRLSLAGDNSNFLALIGASGSGKSSVIKAGILPKIREGVLDADTSWYIAEMTPSAVPLEDLEAALLGIAMSPMPNLLEDLRQDERGLVRIMKRLIPETSKLVLLIDQFEEVFTLIADDAERLHFLNLLFNAAEDERSRIKIIITLRADFYDRPLQYPQFGDLIRRHTELILRLNEQELEAAIVKPAERIGLNLEPGLVTSMIADVFRQPGALPLLQYALTELCERREGRVLQLESYREIGGIMGALARRAEELYSSFAEEEQNAAQQMFLRLINLGEGTDDTRRRVSQADLLSIGNQDAMRKVIEQFGKYRLLTFDHEAQSRVSTVELAHEAMIRQWQRIREWLDSNREELRLHRRLATGAEEWQQAACDPSFLAQGIRLQQFESLKAGKITLTRPEREFLEASLAAYEEQSKAETIRKARELALERQSAQRLRLLTAIVSIAAIISFGLAYFAIQAQSSAEKQASIAATEAAIASENEARALHLQDAAESRLLVSQLLGIHASDPALAYALGLEILKMENPPTAVVYSVNDLFLTNFSIREFFGHSEAVSDVSFAPDGRTALTATQHGNIFLWDVESASIIGEFEGHTAWVPSIVFSPDGQNALSASTDGKVIIWDVANRSPILTFGGHEQAVRVARYTPDGQQVLSGDDTTGLLILWDAATGEEIRRLEGHTDRIWDIAISPDGRYAVSGSNDNSAILWNLETGEVLRHMEYPSFVTSLAFAPDSSHFVLATADRQMFLWTVESEEPVYSYQNLGAVVWGMAIQGETLVTIMENGHLEVWDWMTGWKLQVLRGHRGFGTGLSISPDATRILSVSEDQSMYFWDLSAVLNHRNWASLPSSTIAGHGVLASDNRHLLIGSWNGTASIWDIESEESLMTTTFYDSHIRSVAYAPNMQTVLTGYEDGKLSLWDAATGNLMLEIITGTETIFGLVYLPDSLQAISGSNDGKVQRWDLQTGELLYEYSGHDAPVNALLMLADGQRFVSASGDSNLILWDIESGEALRTYTGHRRSVNAVALSGDGSRMISGSEDSRLILWDIETGEALHEYLGHTGSVTVVAFSPDGQNAISGTNSGAIAIWDLNTGELLRRVDARNWMVGLNYLPNGEEFISVAGDGHVEIWQAYINSNELVEWAENNRYIAELSCEVKLRYYLVSSCEETAP